MLFYQRIAEKTKNDFIRAAPDFRPAFFLCKEFVKGVEKRRGILYNKSMKKYIVAVDEGTTSTRAVLFDAQEKKIKNIVSRPLAQIYPRSGWVEENAGEIYAETLAALAEIIESAADVSEISGIGITNQRETIVLWNRKTGRPVYNAIVWQCRRTAEECGRLKETHAEWIYEKTGLIPDAYFSATKIKWVLENVPEAGRLLAAGDLCAGTVDSYLIFKLTGGRAFVTDASNASRTMLFNIRTAAWDKDLLELFHIPESILPRIVDSDETVGFFEYESAKIPICGIAGDQQAALFGQCCFEEGSVKITYGTGMFMLYNIGGKLPPANGLALATVAYRLRGKTTYALEGSVFNAGSAVQWLRDELGLISASAQSEKMAKKVADNGGVYIVPAFTGLGAPYWRGDARGIITGLTRGINKNHLARAVLEAMAYSAKDLSGVMEKISGFSPKVIRADGGAAKNDFLMQFQADVLGVTVDRPECAESTALGAAFLCGLGLGLFTFEELKTFRKTEKLFIPSPEREYFEKQYEGWNKAVKQCLSYGE